MSRPRRPVSLKSSLLAAASVAAFGLAFACGAQLSVGQWGTFRYIGQVRGSPPLNLLPPISDRSGNLYTLYGSIGLPQVAAFVSRVTGGSYQACTLTEGDVYGAHGWVGFSLDRAWYWSGDALVLVPATGQCATVLDHDPSTHVNLLFRAVIPWVKVAPSRTTLVALIQSPGDPVPYSTLIDLDTAIATNVQQLQPNDAGNLTILGVGADPTNSVGFVLLSYTRNGGIFMEARYIDQSANPVATVPIRGLPPPAYGVLGYLQVSANGRVVGLMSTGSLVTFDRSSGSIVTVNPQITPVGVHKYNGQLWLVGLSGGKPVVLGIDDTGQPQAPEEWVASEQAGAALGGALTVTDDRSFPARTTTWPTVSTAIGTFPFLGPHSPWPHAPDTTLWAAAGPEFQANATKMTAIAVAPVGISYP